MIGGFLTVKPLNGFCNKYPPEMLDLVVKFKTRRIHKIRDASHV